MRSIRFLHTLIHFHERDETNACCKCKHLYNLKAWLPKEWKEAAAGQDRPYYLNHVRGALRLKQTSVRCGMALSSICTVVIMSVLMDQRPVSDIGLTVGDAQFWLDMLKGTAVSFGLILGLLLVELALGWVRPLCYFDSLDTRENFCFNLCIDAIFHIAVAINEELPLRGWMLLNGAEACVVHLGFGASSALLLAVSCQALLFSALHAASPGATRLGE